MTGGVWHAIGTSAVPADGGAEPRSERRSNSLSVGSHMTASSALLDFEGGTYLPWCLRDVPLVSFILVTSGLLLALLIVSFLPQTKLESGFAPLLTARPDDAAFSAANFLYSFLPATLGMILFLLFQSLDQALRILQPWGDMTSLDGAVASRSILADYAACLSLHAPVRALRNGHWRIAVISLMSTLFIFIPILAGGLFMALTAPTQQVRMFPSMPVYGVLVAFLILYVGCASLLVPHRRQFYLPTASPPSHPSSASAPPGTSTRTLLSAPSGPGRTSPPGWAWAARTPARRASGSSACWQAVTRSESAYGE
ncbi:hypothetical protein J3459_010950 [Metarhizium acridum]|nr:hypothetical protein J3459_010950 [Metarhizium acridum]